eukprot:3110790-Amphidinium_carterae.1
MSCCWLLAVGNDRLISNHIVNNKPHNLFNFSCALVSGALAWDLPKRHCNDETMTCCGSEELAASWQFESHLLCAAGCPVFTCELIISPLAPP